MVRAAIAALGVACSACVARAVSIDFVHIADFGGPMNAPDDLSSQFSLEVTAVGSGMVKFEFKNNVGMPSSIMGIFFDSDGSSLTLPMSIDNSAGTNFTDPAVSPAHLPGGGDVGFATTMNLSAGASNPPTNGIDRSGESVELTFSIASGMTFDDIIDQIMDRTIWIGIRVQGIGDDGQFSDAYVTDGPGKVIPLPTGAALGFAGLAPLALRRRR